MPKFKAGDAVWLYWNDHISGYPRMYNRAAVVIKRIHPTCYKLALASDSRKPRDQWRLDSHQHKQHPSDMYPHNLDPGAELRRRREVWKAETPTEVQEAHWKAEADLRASNEKLNKMIQPILARMFA